LRELQTYESFGKVGVVVMDVFNTRIYFYTFLSRMYLEEPPKELAVDLVDKKLPIPETRELNPDLAGGFNLLKNFMQSCEDVEKVHGILIDEFTRLFLGPVPVLFPYESWYVDGKLMGESLLRVKQIYREAGMVKSRGFAEPEDHLALELGFMQHLCEKGELQDQKDFLSHHLLSWVPRFCDDLFAKSRSDFYRGIGRITKGFLFLDMGLVGELL
jgi:TorA maturation chaperone TorD